MICDTSSALLRNRAIGWLVASEISVQPKSGSEEPQNKAFSRSKYLGYGLPLGKHSDLPPSEVVKWQRPWTATRFRCFRSGKIPTRLMQCTIDSRFESLIARLWRGVQNWWLTARSIQPLTTSVPARLKHEYEPLPALLNSCSLEQGNQHGVIGILARILVLDSLRALPPF